MLAELVDVFVVLIFQHNYDHTGPPKLYVWAFDLSIYFFLIPDRIRYM